MKFTPEQQNKKQKLEQILRYDCSVVFDEIELEGVLDTVIEKYTDRVFDIILDPYKVLLELKLIDGDGEYSHIFNEAKI